MCSCAAVQDKVRALFTASNSVKTYFYALSERTMCSFFFFASCFVDASHVLRALPTINFLFFFMN